MSILMAIFLGAVQGLTEFLPVSSSGHLILFQRLFGLPADMLLFDIILHIATLLAVVLVFRKTLMGLILRPFEKSNLRLLLCLLISTALTCTLVLIFKDLIDRTFTYKILPFSFLATAIILFLTSFIKPSARAVTYPSAISVGIAQALAVVPGLSRSGTTISTLLATGTNRAKAAEFSFLMSIPIIIASFVLEMLDGAAAATLPNLAPLACAFVSALVFGIVAIKFMQRIVVAAKFHWFALYLVPLSVACFFL